MPLFFNWWLFYINQVSWTYIIKHPLPKHCSSNLHASQQLKLWIYHLWHLSPCATAIQRLQKRVCDGFFGGWWSCMTSSSSINESRSQDISKMVIYGRLFQNVYPDFRIWNQRSQLKTGLSPCLFPPNSNLTGCCSIVLPKKNGSRNRLKTLGNKSVKPLCKQTWKVLRSNILGSNMQ